MKSRAKYFFLLPGVIWILLFTIFPLIYSLYLSFTDAKLGRAPNFIGLANYVRVFTDDKVREVATYSAFLTIGSLFLTLVFGTFVAWLFNHDLPGLRAMRAVLTMPLFAAPIALGFLGVIIFNETSGPVNNIIRFVGGQPVQWIINPTGARVAVLITDVWQWTPFVFIVVLAAMQGISDEIYEAARLDTTSNWAVFRHITFPLIAPALGTVALLRLVETFKILDIPKTLTGGGPGAATQTYSFNTYLTGLQSPFNQGYASAQAYVVVILAIIISTIYFRRVRARFE
jgi:multiple sugar transport system permease protein